MSHILITVMGVMVLCCVVYEIYHIIKDEPDSRFKEN